MPDYRFITNLLYEPKGTHDSSKTYRIKDTVTSSDGSMVYFALQNVPAGIALTNTTYWMNQINLSNVRSEMIEATDAANAAAEDASQLSGQVEQLSEDVDRLSEEMSDVSERTPFVVNENNELCMEVE